ncbi:MAG: axeA 1 [Chthoniobacteraceae bacterium]|nr:axeA 1 [Chthoniobacteraceae bacterium]
MRLPILLYALAFISRVAFCANTGPWDLAELKKTPRAEWGERAGLTQEVFYEGEPLAGKPTRIFAYLARPEGEGPFPAIVLVHGGGGQAFKDWAEHWAKRGYVALAMDTAGQAKDKSRLPDGGPDQHDPIKFRAFEEDEAREMWTYHAVAAVIRGHSLLASLPEVDRERIGVTGISWGGYLACIVAGLDDRLKVAVSVYGCGSLGDNSYWKEPILDKMPAEQRERWLRLFDPSSYLATIRCPILFLDGTNDVAYPLDSVMKTYMSVRSDLRNISIIIEMPHGHLWTFSEVDDFVDAALKTGVPQIARLRISEVANGYAICVGVDPDAPRRPDLPIVRSVMVNYTVDSGPWQKRVWRTVSVEEKDVVGSTISAKLPMSTTAFFFSGLDHKNRRTTSPMVEVPVGR